MIQVGNAYVDVTFGTGLLLAAGSIGAMIGYVFVKGLEILSTIWGE